MSRFPHLHDYLAHHRDSFRISEQGRSTVLEVMTVDWPSPARPETHWVEFERWETLPSAEVVQESKLRALRDKRYFATCQRCAQDGSVALHLRGQMWADDVCQGCASRYEGVVF